MAYIHFATEQVCENNIYWHFFSSRASKFLEYQKDTPCYVHSRLWKRTTRSRQEKKITTSSNIIILQRGNASGKSFIKEEIKQAQEQSPEVLRN